MYFITGGNTTSEDTVLTVHGWRNQAVLAPCCAQPRFSFTEAIKRICQVVHYVHFVLYTNCSRKEQSRTHSQLKHRTSSQRRSRNKYVWARLIGLFYEMRMEWWSDRISCVVSERSHEARTHSSLRGSIPLTFMTLGRFF